MSETLITDTNFTLSDDDILDSPPVLSATTASQPVTPSVSDSLDKSVTSNLLGSMSSDTMLDTDTNPASTTGISVYSDDLGNPNVALGQYGHSPTQLEQAGYLKPGSSQLVNAMVASGTPPSLAMTPNMFTGKNGINSLDSYVNSDSAQSSVSISNLRQSQTALTNAGIITGNEDSSQISGLIKAGATVGIAPTIATVNGINSINVPTYPSAGSTIGNTPGGFGLSPSSTSLPTLQNNVTGITSGLGGVSGSLVGTLSGSVNNLNPLKTAAGAIAAVNVGSKVLSAIKSGNLAAGLSPSNLLGGLSTSLSALAKVPALAALTQGLRGTSAKAFGAIAASLGTLKGGQPNNLTAALQQTSGALSRVSNGQDLTNLTNAVGQSQIAQATSTGPLSGVLNGVNPLNSIGSSLSQNTSYASVNTLTNNPLTSASSLLAVAKSLSNNTLQSGVSSVASGVNNLPGGSKAIGNIVNNSKNAINVTPGLPSVQNLTQSASIQSLTQGMPNNPLNSTSISGLSSLASGAGSNLSGLTGGISSPNLLSSIGAAAGVNPLLLQSVSSNQPTDITALRQSLNAGLYTGENDPTGVPTPDVSSTLAQSQGDLTQLASSGLSPADQADLQASISSIAGSGPAPIEMPTIATNTTDRTDLTDSIASTLDDPSLPPPDLLGEISQEDISFADSLDQGELSQASAVDQLNSYNTQVSDAYDAYATAVLTYPQGDPRVDVAYQNYQSLLNNPALAQLQAQINV